MGGDAVPVPPGSVPKSEQFQKRMEELFYWSRRRETVREILRKAACFFLLAVVGAGALLLANEEVRAEVIRFFRKDHGTYTEYQFNEGLEWEEEFELYEASWVPEGFVEAYRAEGELSGVTIRYDNVKGEELRELYFGCTNMRYAGISLNTENTKHYEVMYQGEWAEFYESQDEEFLSSFVWQNRNGCYFTLSGKFTLEEFIEITDSVKKTEEVKREKKN